jgi:hypothetical protein
MEPPKRRGRPPNPAIQAQLHKQPEAPATSPAKPEAEAKSPTRRRRASVGGHATKLHAPERPGFVRRWCNDQGNRIADMEDLGYSVVSDLGIETHSPGSVASRRVGIAADGSGLKAILMETPDELYAEGIAEREALHRQVDQAIVTGADPTGQMTSSDGAYGHGSIKVER